MVTCLILGEHKFTITANADNGYNDIKAEIASILSRIYFA